VVEVVTPRTNAATLTAAENLFASLAQSEPIAVEMAADSEGRRFLVRASSDRMRQQLLSQLSAVYPQADLQQLQPDEDPACARAGEQTAACTLVLRAPSYLPLRTFTDLDVDGERAAQADPVLGILSALGDLPPGWRGLSQLVLLAAPENWCSNYQRLSVQHPLEPERIPRQSGNTLPTFVFMAMLLGLMVVALQGYALLRSGDWPALCGLVVASAVVLLGALGLVRRLTRTTLYDMDLVREKVTRIACRAEVRLVIYAPAHCPPVALKYQLDRLAAAYRRFNLATANGLVPRSLKRHRILPRVPDPWSSPGGLPILTTLELAGLWHLPHAAADVALLQRTTARRWLPLPAAVAHGCRIGISRHQEHQVPVAVPHDVLRRHLLLVAKTRRGKSTLMQRLALFAMQVQPRRAVLVLDPHRDLVTSLLGVVPRGRRDDVVYLDVSNADRPFGLNLLDIGLGWGRDQAVANTLTIFQREWGEQYWGPRMEDAFRFALMSLFEANVALCHADPLRGRAAQHTLLEVPTLLSDARFRREVLSTVSDPGIQVWWSTYFEPLERRFQQELVNPVLSKVHRFEGSTAARHIIGQPASTIDPAAWVRDGRLVIINTARGIVGENVAALVGSTLLNLVTLAVAGQVQLEAVSRYPITLFVDEFHTIPGADYEGILSELSKYGANLVLATQSLARLIALDRNDGRGLRATVFANLDGLFAFNCSAEDAQYLVPELGGALDEQDLVELGEHQCYVRITSGGQRLPTFSVQLEPPLVGDPEQAQALAQASAVRFGRDVELVEGDRRSAFARLLQSRTSPEPSLVDEPKRTARNEHRPRKKHRAVEAATAG
jgi:hypothetical protein